MEFTTSRETPVTHNGVNVITHFSKCHDAEREDAIEPHNKGDSKGVWRVSKVYRGSNAWWVQGSENLEVSGKEGVVQIEDLRQKGPWWILRTEKMSEGKV